MSRYSGMDASAFGFANDPSGWPDSLAWLEQERLDRVHACLEATGRYGDGVAACLHQRGHVVSVVNPAQVKDFARSKLGRNKTDKIDVGFGVRRRAGARPAKWSSIRTLSRAATSTSWCAATRYIPRALRIRGWGAIFRISRRSTARVAIRRRSGLSSVWPAPGAPGSAGSGLDARASRFRNGDHRIDATFGPLRPPRRPAHPAPARRWRCRSRTRPVTASTWPLCGELEPPGGRK